MTGLPDRLCSLLTTSCLCLVAVGVVPSSALADAPDREQVALITLACGGFGREESTHMLSLQVAHSLTLIFAEANGAYLSGVRVRIDDPLSDLAVEERCGPIGLVDVPRQGRYRVSAWHAGEQREQWVDLAPMSGARLVLRW